MNKQFKAVSMDCTQEQFEQLRPHLEKIEGVKIKEIAGFEKYTILVNNYVTELMVISNTHFDKKDDFNRTYLGEFNPKAFIEACGCEWVEEKPETPQSETKFKEVPFNWETYLEYKDKGAYLEYEGERIYEAYKFTTANMFHPIVILYQDVTLTFTINGKSSITQKTNDLKLFIPTTTKTIRVWAKIESGEVAGVTYNRDNAKYWTEQGCQVIELTKEIEL